ncbi:DUF2817 domain-containing protein [Agarivorans aestuarii]|uniref:DUF2817 domain-containing protein n=1 Tax=Agarivorans aestuarii TaxID=1563703 RepID=UPI001C8255E3|nr:DUF2817 domain-containing protein [Agarivorans aestuarii]
MQGLSEFPEMDQLLSIIKQFPNKLKVELLCEVKGNTDASYPVHAISLGKASIDKPGVLFVGGVHGVERIGSQVVLSFLASLLNRLDWDLQLQQLLDECYLAFIPIVNPGGMVMQRRSNAKGVDLMRNSPSIAKDGASFMVGGQQISSKLPWFRGNKGEAMETENRALVEFVKTKLFPRPFSLVLDCHSGFGHSDRLWFPYANSASQAIVDLGVVYRLRKAFFTGFPHQNYLFEPQTKHYVCHGDLWDYCYDQSLNHSGTFVPLTLEMGSWRWLKKNPLQVFNSLGLYHPMKPHRVQRVLRRHLVLMEFLMDATYSWQTLFNDPQLELDKLAAIKKWYS